MSHLVNLKNKKDRQQQNAVITSSNTNKAKTTFKDDWEKAIPIEEARKHLLKTARDLWKK